MNLSPQSDAIIQRLLSKQTVTSGKLTIGPLQDPAVTLLTVFVNHYDDLSKAKGEERARKLRERYAHQKTASTAGKSTKPALSRPALPITSVSSPQWRLVTLRCVSIRGIAPPGESFEFSFDSQPCLLYGPNGSGKTSLLSAIIWVLTGAAIVDTATAPEQVPMYSLSSRKSSGAKVRDWPLITTLPNVLDLSKATTHCRAEVLIERPGDHTQLWLGRSQGASLEASTDGLTWIPLTDITAIGISPLDIQLSLIAPTTFGRRSIEEAENTRSILSLMLGFDDLEQLGELASQLSTNRTKLANIEQKEIETKVAGLQASLRLLLARLPDGSDSAKAIQNLAATPTLTVAQFDTTVKQPKEAVTRAESHLAQVLGLSNEDGSHSGDLADRLTVAIDRLAKGFDANFSSLSKLRLANALPADGTRQPAERLSVLLSDFDTFHATAKAACGLKLGSSRSHLA